MVVAHGTGKLWKYMGKFLECLESVSVIVIERVCEHLKMCLPKRNKQANLLFLPGMRRYCKLGNCLVSCSHSLVPQRLVSYRAVEISALLNCGESFRAQMIELQRYLLFMKTNCTTVSQHTPETLE